MPSSRSRIRDFLPSRTRWLQLAACAVVAWALFGDGLGTAEKQTLIDGPQAQTVPSAEQKTVVVTPPAAAVVNNSAAFPNSGEEPTQAPALSTPSTPLALATIEVIVGRNDTLDRIFRRLQLNLADLASLRSLPNLDNKLDRLYPGEALKLQHRGTELLGLERKLSPSETLRVVRQDTGFLADVLENPLEVKVRTVHGVIDHSLFAAVTAAGAHDQTAMSLAEIFGWDIDFVLDIQPGDSFTVTYEELSQDGEYLKDGNLLAARFTNQGREHVALRYVGPDGVGRYYDPEGRPLRKAFLRAPLEFSRVSSRFNLKRRHPLLNRIRAHKGVDYAAPTGTPIRAAGDGRIRFAGRKGGYGNVIEIAHSRGVVTRYGHLSRFAKGMRAGRKVAQGSVIAYVGMSGLATGPHLHYEYMLNGKHKNPQTVQLPDAQPIEEKLRPAFLEATRPLLASLDSPIGPMLVAR